MTDNVGYNFIKNITKLSQTKDSNNLSDEWICVSYNRSEDGETCVCNRRIHDVYTFYNKITNNFIYVGSTCMKNLRLKNSLGNIKKLFSKLESGERGEYEEIIDLLRYSDMVRNQFIEMVNNKLKSEWRNDKNMEFLKNILVKLNIDSTNLDIITRYLNEKYIEQEAILIRRKKEKEMKIQREQLLEKARLDRLEKDQLECKRMEEARLQDLRIQEEIRIERLRIEEENKNKFIELNNTYESERYDIKKKLKHSIRSEIPNCKKCVSYERCKKCVEKINKIYNSRIAEELRNNGVNERHKLAKDELYRTIGLL